MKKFIAKFLNALSKFIFPPQCLVCGSLVAEYDAVCGHCWADISFINRPFCEICSTPFEYEIDGGDLCGECSAAAPPYLRARSATIYNRQIAKIIFDLKYYDNIQVSKFLAKIMVRAASDIIDSIDIIVPVPLHKKRLRHRKFNQSAILARDFASITKKQSIVDFLFRTRNSRPQAKLKGRDRKNNLESAFEVSPKYLRNIDRYRDKSYAIIDDVMTTGTTIRRCVAAMREHGINKIYIITVAKTVK